MNFEGCRVSLPLRSEEEKLLFFSHGFSNKGVFLRVESWRVPFML